MNNLAVSQYQNFKNQNYTLKIMDFNYSTPVKETQTPNKANKTHNQTRQGDWVCFNCNNLNFSFRKKCNRCKTQTRKQNQDLQNAYTLYYYNQQDGTFYSYETGAVYNPHESNDMESYYVSDIKSQEESVNGFIEVPQSPLMFSRSHTKVQVIEVTLTSPFKDILNSNEILQEKINKKLRTPSSRKKKSTMKKNDLLPSVSPLLKKLLAKEDTNSKENMSHIKDPLNVALFYDEIWNSSNKENLLNINENKENICLTNSGKKVMRNSHIQKTNDSLCNPHQDEGFSYLLRSPQREYQEDEIIEIDEGDEQLAHIISRIII